jgi:rare lipoprotein A
MLSKRLTQGMVAALLIAPLAAFAKTGSAPTQQGVASFYSDALHGRRTASGERYDKAALTAAHKSLPLGTRVRVTRLSTGDSVVVRINDRGPFVKGRVIDLSHRAARALGITEKGVVKVRLEVLERRDGDDA